MEDLLEIYKIAERSEETVKQMTKEFLEKIHVLFWGSASLPATTLQAVSNASPVQTKKRRKRLTAFEEDEVEVLESNQVSPNKSGKGVEKTLKATSAPRSKLSETTQSAETLMPPPLAPEETSNTRPQRVAKIKSEKNLKEPSLMAKLRRPSNSDIQKIKLENEHRESQMHEVARSTKTSLSQKSAKISTASIRSTDSVLILPATVVSTIVLSEDEEVEVGNDKERKKKSSSISDISMNGRKLRIKIKREPQPKDKENLVIPIMAPPSKVPTPQKNTLKSQNTNDLSPGESSTLSNSSNANTTKKSRKKKTKNHQPIKVERFSDINVQQQSPIASRTRKLSTERKKEPNKQQEEVQPERELKKGSNSKNCSIYEDAVENLPLANVAKNPVLSMQVTSKINETVTIVDAGKQNNTIVQSADATFVQNAGQTTLAPGQTTFVVDNVNPNDPGGMCDATFNVVPQKEGKAKDSISSAKLSMETAHDTTQPQNNSLITEDESFEPPATIKLPPPKAPKPISKPYSAKCHKIPTRTNELFNPLVESPVKKKVQAFENVAHAAATVEKTQIGRLKRTKENSLRLASQTSSTTPIIAKVLSQPALGRFLTPTLSSNFTPSVAAAAKKAPASATKAAQLPKSNSASNLKSTNSTSSKNLLRENSTDEFRKGLHQMAEERKKQREQKHILAAQQREAKERERAERIAKLAQEREEKRIKKQQESEFKKRELEEIQRKLRQHEELQNAEANKQKAAKLKAIEQERELLSKMNQQSGSGKLHTMMPPPAKVQSKYTFEMLHEDDSTDEEGKVTHKRPQPPHWSQSHVRGPALRVQEYMPTQIIDSLFSVAPMTPDLKLIFPNIDARHLKRNSSALWSTPPRYSELPKY